MFSNNVRLIFLLFIFATAVHGQGVQNDTSSFRIVIEGGAGYSYRLSAPKLTLGEEQRNGPAVSFRIKWGSNRNIGVGLETGWIGVSSLKTTLRNLEFGAVDISSSLSAVPVIGFIALQRSGIEVTAGIGYYHVTSASTVMGASMESNEWDLGYLLSLGYAVPLTAELGIIGTIRWNNIAEQQISAASLQAQIQYRIY